MTEDHDFELSADDIAALLEVDKKTGKTVFELRQCQHCGGVHDRACPRVKRMSFTPSGGLAEVEFWDRWDAANVIFPEMLGVIGDDEDVN